MNELKAFILVAILALAHSLQLPRQGRIIYPQEDENEERFKTERLIRNSPQILLNSSDLLEPPPGQRCAGRNYQDRRCCTPEQPCGYGEGDCDGPLDGGPNDGHDGCKGDLVCGSNNCLKFGAFYHPKDDCCDDPSTIIDVSKPLTISNPRVPLTPPPGQRCRGRNYDGKRCCSPEAPCDEGEGDCDGPGDGGQHDGHAGCKGDLVCGTNNCKQFGHYFHEKDDCCERARGSRQQCFTNSGHYANVPCVFPFVYNGVQYDKCTWTDADNRHNQPWCATSVDNDNGYISGHWGNCDRSCPTLDDNVYSEVEQLSADVWSPWSVFSPCSASCGRGQTQRSRQCNNPEVCPHTMQSQTRSCNLNPC